VDLSSLAHNLDSILNNLKKQLNICKQQIGRLVTQQRTIPACVFYIEPNMLPLPGNAMKNDLLMKDCV
jgi:hypothetical protein